MATGIHSTNDISSDEFYARKLQKEEEDRAKEEARRKRAALFRKRIRELSSSDQIQVVQNDEDDDIIVIDDDDEDNVNRRQLNSRPRNASPKKKESPRNEDTNSDELLARRLQEEFDKELAKSLSRNEQNPFRRHNSLSQINSSSTTENNNSNFRIPDSIQSDILYNLARERNTRNNNNNPTSINSPFHSSNNIMYNSSRSSNSNNNDPINDLATAFNFIHNQQFMDDFLSDDNQNTRNRNNSNVPNNNRRQTNTRNQNQTNRIASNLLLGGSSLRGRGRQNPLFGLLANQRDFTADDYDSLLRLDELNGVKKCLNKQEIESLPTFQFRENNETPEENTCSICFEVYTTKDKLTSLACLHKFHKNCIKDWLKESRQCPLCKKDAINGN